VALHEEFKKTNSLQKQQIISLERESSIMTQNCPSCYDPTSPTPIWEGKSTGKIIKIGEIETYIAQAATNENQKSKRVILFLTEGHSIYFINAQLLADSFASYLNCDVIMPDQFSAQERVPQGFIPHFPEGGSIVKPDVGEMGSDTEGGSAEGKAVLPPPFFKSKFTPETLEKWKKGYEPEFTDPIIEKVVQYIYSTYGNKVNIGGVGYCFGGRYIIRLMGSGVIDVGVVNHPSFFTMEEVGKLGMGKELALYAAERDNILPAEKRREMEDLLTRNGVTWMSTVFSGTEHGFSVRGDLNVKEVRLAKEKAFKGAIQWFNDWL
jgi:dienelactone hydrolase